MINLELSAIKRLSLIDRWNASRPPIELKLEPNTKTPLDNSYANLQKVMDALHDVMLNLTKVDKAALRSIPRLIPRLTSLLKSKGQVQEESTALLSLAQKIPKESVDLLLRLDLGSIIPRLLK